MADDNGGGGQSHWTATLPAQYHNDATLTRYADLPAFVEGHKNLLTKLGQKAEFTLPTDDAGWGKVDSLLRPKDHTAYNLPGDKDAAVAKLFHKHAIHPRHAEALFKDLAEIEGSGQKQRQQEQETQRQNAVKNRETHFKGKWGAKYDEENKLADSILNDDRVFPKELRDALNASGLNHHPALVEIANFMGHRSKEGNYVPGSDNSGTGAATDVKSRWDALMKFQSENSALLNSLNLTDERVAAVHAKRRELMVAHAEAELAAEGGA